MGATAFTGDWGSTKTLRMTERAHRRWLQGWRVVTNYGYIHGEYVESAGDVLRLVASMIVRDDLRPVFLGLDEAGRLFPARGWSRWPPEMDLICQEARKLGLEFCYTVPSLDNVDAQLRRATSRVVCCKAFFEKLLSAKGEFPIRKRPRLSRWVEWACVEGKKTEKKDAGWRRWSRDAVVAGTYDTYTLIAGTERALLAAADRLDSVDAPQEWGDAAGGAVVNVEVVGSEPTKRRHRMGPRAS